MKKVIFILICSLSISYNSSAQSIEKLWVEGNYYLDKGDYFSALHFLELLIQKDSTYYDAWPLIAKTYRETHQYKNSIKWYKKLAQKGLDSDARLWWGVGLKSVKEYDLAIEVLRYYLNEKNDPSSWNYRKALMELKGATLAKQLSIDSATTIRKLDKEVNTTVAEMAPFPLADSVLYFSSLRPIEGLETEQWIGHHSKLYVQENGQKAKVFGPLKDYDSHVSNLTFNPTSDQLFFTKCKSVNNKIRCQIYSSTLENNLWSKPEKLDKRFNPSATNNTHPQWGFWNKQEGLFLSSDRMGGLGAMDLWFVPLNGVAMNLGKGINTSGNELTPFYHSIEQKLYFSSDFHPGIGGYDIFQVDWDNGWGIVQNVGIPLNSSHNDLYYVSRLDSSALGYLSSNRIGSYFVTQESCCTDIYTFKKSEYCVCQTVDSLQQVISLQLPLNLFFHNDQPNPGSRDTSTSLSYEETVDEYLKLEKEYVQKYSEVLSGKIKSDVERKIRQFFKQEVKFGFEQLQSLLQQLELTLELGAKIELNVKGFASPLTNEDYNKRLSKRRIGTLLNYMEQYKRGVFIPFIQQGQLVIIELPIGEAQVNNDVSDNPNDLRQSVYSLSAARERKLEIRSITIELID